MQGHLGKMTRQEDPLALGDLPITMFGGNGAGGVYWVEEYPR